MAKLSDIYGITKPEKRKALVEVAPQVRVKSRPGVRYVPVTFSSDEELERRIDAEWHKRGLRSRSETIRVLLAEALK